MVQEGTGDQLQVMSGGPYVPHAKPVKNRCRVFKRDDGCLGARACLDAVKPAHDAAVRDGKAVGVGLGLKNSGLGNAVSPLTSLTPTFRIPLLLLVTWRGQPNGPKDEPQHHLMGRITSELLELMGIPWEKLPSDPALVDAVLRLDGFGDLQRLRGPQRGGPPGD